jgi:eukaryotic-like serine/threonine-protein kinase
MTAPGEKSSDDDSAPSGVTSVSGPYRPGEVIDEKYTLVRKIGEGGMGAVWVGHNNVLDVHCALKLLELGASSQQAQRLLDEARAAAKLGHPNIVRMLDYGETPRGDPFIAMELLDGEDLAQLMERLGTLPALEAVQLLLPIAHALGTAHAKGIVHRDVKPENIFLAKDEVATTMPKLLDFGIVRQMANPRRLTLDGAVLGTPDYMSPEQARGQATTGQTDLWGFGVVLFELIAGRRPFEADNYNSLMRQIIEDKPPTLAELGRADEELSAIVGRALAKSQDSRWLSMRELGEELALWLEGHGVHDDVAGTSLRRSWLADTESKRIELPAYVREQLETAAGIPRRAISQQRRVVAGPTQPDAVPDSAVPEVEQQEKHLTALAELHAQGDPEELLARATRNRNLAIVIGILIVTIGAVIIVLIGTGIIET